MRTAVCFLLCFFVAVSVTACRTTWYEIELQPDGDTMQRKVSMWLYTTVDGVKTYDAFDDDQLALVSQLYGLPMPTNLAQRHEFEGRFQTGLPEDVTDGGWYLHQPAAMGSINSYVEHVGGGEKISWNLETRRKSLNRLVDVCLAWLDAEFGADERYPPLREFVDFVIRDDLWNVALYLWSFDTLGLVGKDRSDEAEIQLSSDLLIRVGVYLAERDYLDPAELPEMVRRVAVAVEAEQSEVVLSLVLRGLATKLGTGPDEPLPWPMQDIVDDLDTYATSLELFVTESDTIQTMVEGWEQEYWDSLSPSEQAEQEEFERRTAEAIEKADPDEVIILDNFVTADGRPSNFVYLERDTSVLSQLLDMALGLELDLFSSSGSDILSVVLHLPQEPLVTNGTWDTDGMVRWRENISPGGKMGNRLPDVFHALWVEPATDFQEEHFGKVVLNGEELFEHVGWYMTLPAELAQEWDDFVTGLEPGSELIESLRSFCFSSELTQCEARPGTAYASLSDIARALNSGQEAVLPDEPGDSE